MGRSDKYYASLWDGLVWWNSHFAAVCHFRLVFLEHILIQEFIQAAHCFVSQNFEAQMQEPEADLSLVSLDAISIFM